MAFLYPLLTRKLFHFVPDKELSFINHSYFAVSLVKLIIYFLITSYLFIYLFIISCSDLQIEDIDSLLRRKQMLPYGFVFPPKGTSERRPLHSERHHRHQGSSLSAPHRPPDAGEAVDQEQRGQQRATGSLSFLSFCAFTRVVLSPNQFARYLQGSSKN